jgi:hypothetical protein
MFFRASVKFVAEAGAAIGAAIGAPIGRGSRSVFARPRWSRGLVAVATAVVLAGCGGAPEERYIPDAARARRALETALAAWKDGAPNETIKTAEPPVDVYDARWRNGKKLESFEILSELPADPHRTFKVRVRFAGAAQNEEDSFLVMGIDPILVFRADDYQRATGM